MFYALCDSSNTYSEHRLACWVRSFAAGADERLNADRRAILQLVHGTTFALSGLAYYLPVECGEVSGGITTGLDRSPQGNSPSACSEDAGHRRTQRQLDTRTRPIVADRAAWPIGDRRVIVHRLRPLMRGVRRNFVYPDSAEGPLADTQRLRLLVVRVYEASASITRSPPQPCVSDMCVPVRARRNRGSAGRMSLFVCS